MRIAENQTCELHPNFSDLFEVNVPGPSSRNACQVRRNNSCGSGSFIGFRGSDALVLTNYHVLGGGVGATAQLKFNFGSGDVVKVGTAIMAAYSTRVTADWAILAVPNWTPPVPPAWGTRKRPTNDQRFYTTGSPSCVYPLRHQSGFHLLSNNGNGFAVWSVPAIPGQSGSGVWDLQTNWQQILLTWRTSQNRGAGQPLDYLWQQGQTALETGVLMGAPMPDDLEPLSDVAEDCEEGFFAESSIRSLNIWFEDQKPSDPDPTDPVDPSDPFDKTAAIEAFRKIETESRQARLALEGGATNGSGGSSGGPTFGL